MRFLNITWRSARGAPHFDGRMGFSELRSHGRVEQVGLSVLWSGAALRLDRTKSAVRDPAYAIHITPLSNYAGVVVAPASCKCQ